MNNRITTTIFNGHSGALSWRTGMCIISKHSVSLDFDHLGIECPSVGRKKHSDQRHRNIKYASVRSQKASMLFEIFR